jgi:hypothetical protein
MIYFSNLTHYKTRVCVHFIGKDDKLARSKSPLGYSIIIDKRISRDFETTGTEDGK